MRVIQQSEIEPQNLAREQKASSVDTSKIQIQMLHQSVPIERPENPIFKDNLFCERGDQWRKNLFQQEEPDTNQEGSWTRNLPSEGNNVEMEAKIRLNKLVSSQQEATHNFCGSEINRENLCH